MTLQKEREGRWEATKDEKEVEEWRERHHDTKTDGWKEAGRRTEQQKRAETRCKHSWEKVVSVLAS